MGWAHEVECLDCMKHHKNLSKKQNKAKGTVVCDWQIAWTNNNLAKKEDT